MHVSLDSALGRQRRLNSVGESVLQIAPSAAAAYSLRSLTGGDPKVVRVRRDTDNAWQDFTASGVSSGALTSFTNADYAKYTSDFSSGDDSWGAFDDVTETGNIDGIGGLDDNLRLAIGSATSNHRAFRSNVLPVNQKFNFSARIFIPSTNSVVDSIMIRDASNNVIVASTTPTQDEWVTVTANNVTLTNAQLRVNLQNGGLNNFAGNGSDVIYLREVTVTQVTSDGFVDTWYDQSGNNRPLIQTTASEQPLIVEAGTFLNGVKSNKATSNDTMQNLQVSTDGTNANFGTDDWASGASSKLGAVYVGTVPADSAASVTHPAVIWGGGRAVNQFQAGGVALSAIKGGTDSWSIRNERQDLSPSTMANSTSLNTDADVILYGTTDNREFTINVNGSGDTETESADLDVREDTPLSLFGAYDKNGNRYYQRSSGGVCKECYLYAGDSVANVPALATSINAHYSIY
jgi:hypothetical protein